MDQQESIAKLKTFATQTLFLLHASEQLEGRIYRPKNDPAYDSRISALQAIGAVGECVCAWRWARRAAAEELLERGDLKVWESETLNHPPEPPKKTLAEKMQEIRAGGLQVSDRVRVTCAIDRRCGQDGDVVEILDHGSWPIIVKMNNGDRVGYPADWLRRINSPIHAIPTAPIPPELTIGVGSRARVVRGPLTGFAGRVLQIVENQTRIRIGHKGDGPFIEVPIGDVEAVPASESDRIELREV